VRGGGRRDRVQHPAPETAIDDSKSKVTAVDVAEFEITESGIDRFTSCPPAGDLGQQWIPPIPAWTPAAGVAAPVETPSERDAGDESPSAEQSRGTAERLERFYGDTRMEFRHCYHRGLLYDPTQDGHAAIVLASAPTAAFRKSRCGRVRSLARRAGLHDGRRGEEHFPPSPPDPTRSPSPS